MVTWWGEGRGKVAGLHGLLKMLISLYFGKMAGGKNPLRFVFLADLGNEFSTKNSVEVAIEFIRGTYSTSNFREV